MVAMMQGTATATAREPEFRSGVEQLRGHATDVALSQLTALIPDPAWARWAAQLVSVVAIEAVTAWLNVGQPDPESAGDRIRQTIAGILHAAGAPEPTDVA